MAIARAPWRRKVFGEARGKIESLTPGPRLPGGGRALLLQSDDNFSAGQIMRVDALGVEDGQPR